MWHTVVFKFNDTHITSFVDDEEMYIQNEINKFFIMTEGLFYLGWLK